MASSDYYKAGIESALRGHKSADEIKSILNQDPIRTLLEEGCYLAGGFVRSILLNQSPRYYLSSIALGGDVDIFFDDPSKRDRYLQIFQGYLTAGVSRSLGNNAAERHVEASGASIRIQLVDHSNLILPVEKQLDRFDITNCAVAMNKHELIIHRRFYEIESKRLLDVKHSESPFTAGRIMRYITRRGLEGLTVESQTVVTDWIMKAMCGSFKTDTAAVIHPGQLESAVKSLLSSDIASRPDDLLLVLGKFKHDINEPYGLTRQVDFAMHRLQERVKVDEHVSVF